MMGRESGNAPIHSFQCINTENCTPQSIQITLIREDPFKNTFWHPSYL